jgi:hypothetical protein
MSPERVYRLLLRAYPAEFRAEYGQEMMLLFRDQCRDSDARTFGFWARVLSDVIRSAPALRAKATRTVEVIMKLAAVLTVLLGVIGVLNAGVEWGAGAGAAQTIQGAHAVSLMLGVFASLLLLAAGVALLSGTPRSRQAARLALLASVVMIVAARLLFPWMSIFSQLVGIGLPVAFLIALSFQRRASLSGAI